MNSYFLAAGILLFIVGLTHSVLGERLVFRRMRSAGFIPTNGGQLLREPHVRILWASWHLGTAMGWGISAILFWLALPSSRFFVPSPIFAPIVAAMAVSMFACAALVLIGTKGRHPGWLGLLGVAVLITTGMYA